MQNLYKIISAILAVLFIASTNCYSEEKFYTAYNIWKWGGYNNAFINYKGGRAMIPAGTEIKDRPLIFDNQPWNNNRLHPEHVLFRTLPDKRKHRMHFILRFHPKKTIEDYVKYTFTSKNFETLTAGFTQNEIDAIKKGEIVDGMSKEAVLVSYGYPTERQTRSLDKNTWIYYINSKVIKNVTFNSKGRTGPETLVIEKRKQESAIQDKIDNQDSASEFENKLMMLKKLLDKGIISQDEYDKKRTALLEEF